MDVKQSIESEKTDVISLAGEWALTLDREDVGANEKWFTPRGAAHPPHAQTQPATLPGSLDVQSIGDAPGPDTAWTGGLFDPKWKEQPHYQPYVTSADFKIPFFLQPKTRYVGVAWYRKMVEIPEAWVGRRVVLTLERAHWETRVWVDGEAVGTNQSLAVPHIYELGTSLAAGSHEIVIRIDNRMIQKVGENAHSISDHTQGNWNGVVGNVELKATSPVWIDDVQAYPDVTRRAVKLMVSIGNASGHKGRGTLTAGSVSTDVLWDATGSQIEMIVPLGAEASLWDEFDPALHTVNVTLLDETTRLDTRSVRFGLRDFKAEGTQFTINGRKTFLRGTLECCIFPRTGHPPTDVGSWKRIIDICKAHGLNHIRFHSWCPPEAAFIAADELGMYLQVEACCWSNFDARVGEGDPVDAWIPLEAERILRTYGNHPSFVLFAYGNEPAGEGMIEYLTKLVHHWKATDPRRLYTTATGWASVPENDFHSVMRVNEKIPARGRLGWLGGDYREGIGASPQPVVSHEIGQHCVYPVFAEAEKYTGHLQAKNYAIFRDSLAAQGMLEQADAFVKASGKLQAICYKEDIEAALRTPGMGGFQLLDLHDFPGQGTALVGILDAFWDAKGYVTPEEFRRFSGETVPLARLPRRTYLTNETIAVDVEVAHFGATELADAVVEWRLTDAEDLTVAAGALPPQTIPIGNGTPVGTVTIDLSRLEAPAALRLVVSIRAGATTPTAENDWPIWLYPASPETAPTNVLVAHALDATTLDQLNAGATVFLLPQIDRLAPEHPAGSFIPIFWNKLLMKDQLGQTLGILCDPKHPALQKFPTASHTDFQWEDILQRSRFIVLDGLPALTPIVQPIDDWNTNRRLGLVFECRVGKGKLLVCSADLSSDLENRIAARQLRKSLLAYVASAAFLPETSVDGGLLSEIFRDVEPPVQREAYDPSMVPMTT